MAYREVRVYEIKEVLRWWMRGEGYRSIARAVGVDRRTARGYVEAAVAAGLDREGGESQLSDELMAQVVEAVRPERPRGHGEAWEALLPHEGQIRKWLDPKEGDLTVAKVGDLLARRGVVVPPRTLYRFALERCGAGRNSRRTVRVTDPPPGQECQVDFGRMGYITDRESRKRRLVHALVVTACYSRHCFVWLTHSQRTEDVIAGLEAAWAFFGGVFPVLIPDNLKPVVETADATNPRFNQAFFEYAQSRGFHIDAARVRRPQDKGRVENGVRYARRSFFAGENFQSLAEAQKVALHWCAEVAGLRVHGTTRARPAEVFAMEEAALLLAAPTEAYDLPIYANPRLHPDRHVEVAKALYSVPGEDLVGKRLEARADTALVRIYYRGTLIKTHPRQPPGGRSTDPADLPSEKSACAMRDIDKLQRLAASHGVAIGTYAELLLGGPLPWTKMRQCYRLLSLVRRYGAKRVEETCQRALEAEAVDVGLIGRMLERGASPQPHLPGMGKGVSGRFARDPGHFAVRRETKATEEAPGSGAAVEGDPAQGAAR